MEDCKDCKDKEDDYSLLVEKWVEDICKLREDLWEMMVSGLLYIVDLFKNLLIVPEAVVEDMDEISDDKIMWVMQMLPVLFLILVAGLVMMMLLKKTKDGETILQINSYGDWEYAPSIKRKAAIKF